MLDSIVIYNKFSGENIDMTEYILADDITQFFIIDKVFTWENARRYGNTLRDKYNRVAMYNEFSNDKIDMVEFIYTDDATRSLLFKKVIA
ncbi:hypothetical protein AN639_05790 [Candidatus Epulonipiscium fishelsonii]|nr:hypothetical protein AN639_05790 [Epulopiscium sp. SCG-B05WGA-EpuloA1]